MEDSNILINESVNKMTDPNYYQKMSCHNIYEYTRNNAPIILSNNIYDYIRTDVRIYVTFTLSNAIFLITKMSF